MHENRVEFAQKVQVAVSEDLHKNGLELESVSLTGLDQTAANFFNPQNAFDAQGLTKLTQEIERRQGAQRRRARHEDRHRAEESRDRAPVARYRPRSGIRASGAGSGSESARGRSRRNRAAAGRTPQGGRRGQDLLERAIAEAEIDKRRLVEQRDIEREQRRAHRAAGTRDRRRRNRRRSRRPRRWPIPPWRNRWQRRKTSRRCATPPSPSARRPSAWCRRASRRSRSDRDQGRGRSGEAGVHRPRRGPAHRGHGRRRLCPHQGAGRRGALSGRSRGQARDQRSAERLNDEQVRMEIRLELLRQLPTIIEQSVKPMERIDGIKIMDVRGLGGSEAATDRAWRVRRRAPRRRRRRRQPGAFGRRSCAPLPRPAAPGRCPAQGDRPRRHRRSQRPGGQGARRAEGIARRKDTLK